MAEVVVTGANGHVGSAVTQALGERGIPMRTAGLDPESLATRFPTATSVARLDFHDQSTFHAAVSGARAVFLIRPPAISTVGNTINPFIDAVADEGVDHIVFSSVAGADTKRVIPHHRIERHLFGSGVDWTILRPGFFAQNIESAYRQDIRQRDEVYVPAGDGRAAFVDTRDIGEVAATVAIEDDRRGKSYHLTGAEAIDFHRVAEIPTSALGRSITYRPAAVVPYLFHLIRQGLALPHALVQTVLNTGLRRGDAATVTGDLEELLGRPARTVEGYAIDQVKLFQRPEGRIS